MRTRTPRGFVAPMALALLAFFLFGPVGEAFGQTPYVPYFGKNRIRYNDFKWNIYKTDHFEIYYYPEIEKQLERDLIRRERVSAGQFRSQTRSRLQGPPRSLQDGKRVPAAEYRAGRVAGRRAGVRRAVPRSHGAA